MMNKGNCHANTDTFEELIRNFNLMLLNTIRYERHFNVILDIVIKEDWKELDKLLASIRKCEINIKKITDNLKGISKLRLQQKITQRRNHWWK